MLLWHAEKLMLLCARHGVLLCARPWHAEELSSVALCQTQLRHTIIISLMHSPPSFRLRETQVAHTSSHEQSAASASNLSESKQIVVIKGQATLFVYSEFEHDYIYGNGPFEARLSGRLDPRAPCSRLVLFKACLVQEHPHASLPLQHVQPQPPRPHHARSPCPSCSSW